jgi:hypothetical protein
MSLRNAVFAIGLTCSGVVAYGQEQALRLSYDLQGTMLEATADRPMQCSNYCTVTFHGQQIWIRYGATRVEKNPRIDTIRLEGKARVMLPDGTEIQAEKMAITSDRGRLQLSGVELRFIDSKK